MIPQILYDPRRTEDWDILMSEIKRQGIERYNVWNPVYQGTVIESINASQRAIVQYAKDNEWGEVLLFEQDIWFPSVNGFKYFMDNKPVEFDIYLGGSYLIDNRIEYKAPLTKIIDYVGHHCIIVSKRYFDRFLDTDKSSHIDTAQNGRGDFYLCYPMPALQRASWSANNKAITDYNGVLNPENIYN